MRIVPVIDLKGGLAVRGRSGERASYRPVKSRLRGGAPEDLSDPIRLLRAYRGIVGSECVYVADLDRIAGQGDNRALIERLSAAEPGVVLFLDEGPQRERRSTTVPEGCLVPIVATESLASLSLLTDGPAIRAPGGACFGLDLTRHGVLSCSAEVAALGAPGLLRLAERHGFRAAIVLLLDGVGTGAGLPRDHLKDLRQAAPKIDLYAAGGIASCDDLELLRAEGFSGALLATALHEAWIPKESLRQWRATHGD